MKKFIAVLLAAAMSITTLPVYDISASDATSQNQETEVKGANKKSAEALAENDEFYIQVENYHVWAKEGESAVFEPTIYDYDYNVVELSNPRFTYKWYKVDENQNKGNILSTNPVYEISSVSIQDYTNNGGYYLCDIYVDGYYLGEATFLLSYNSGYAVWSQTYKASEGQTLTLEPSVQYETTWETVDKFDDSFSFKWYRENDTECLGEDSEYIINSLTYEDFSLDNKYYCKVFYKGVLIGWSYVTIELDYSVVGETYYKELGDSVTLTPRIYIGEYYYEDGAIVGELEDLNNSNFSYDWVKRSENWSEENDNEGNEFNTTISTEPTYTISNITNDDMDEDWEGYYYQCNIYYKDLYLGTVDMYIVPSYMKIPDNPGAQENKKYDSVNMLSSQWTGYFGVNEGWYEGAEGKLTSQTNTSWNAKLNMIGWGGIWGGQIYQAGTLDIERGKEYSLKFWMKSSKCDKWVFIMFGTSGNYAFAKWIKLPRGVWVSIDETFVAKIDADSMFYGIGGEMGDRTGIDYDAEIRYSYAPDGPSSVVDGDSSVATQITCSDMVLALKSDIDKIDGKNQETEQPTTQPQEQETTVRLQEQVTTTKNIVKADNKDKKPKASSIKKIKKAKKSLKVTWKKVKNITGYQLQYSTSKKFKNAKKITIKKAKTTSKTIKKLKAKKKYYVRIRTYITVNGKKQYSDWSKAKSQKTK